MFTHDGLETGGGTQAAARNIVCRRSTRPLHCDDCRKQAKASTGRTMDHACRSLEYPIVVKELAVLRVVTTTALSTIGRGEGTSFKKSGLTGSVY
eukprot:1167060-Pyramimonas_sp.AAC.3